MDALLELLVEQWSGVLFRQRADLMFEFSSPRLALMTGISEDDWRSKPGLFMEVIHEEDAELVRRHLKEVSESPKGAGCAFRVRHCDTGQITYVSEFRRAQRDATGVIQGYAGFWTDVTRQALAERRLASAAWKETAGLVTQGLAHDFNNVLAGILGLSETFLMQIDEQHPFHRGLGLIKQNANQAVQIVRRISLLQRSKPGTCTYQDLNALVTENAELLSKVLPKRIALRSTPTPDQIPLYVDATEFQQVLVQLALNAADAMPEGGTLTLQASQAETFGNFQAGLRMGQNPRLPAACLEIIDTGLGIKPHLLPYIFDPFFSTKPLNRGSGLGLYNVRLFAEKHGAMITVDSAEGRGTTVRIWFPVADFTEAETAQARAEQHRKCLLLAGRPGRLRDATAELLRSHGYFVFPADADADDLLRSAEHAFDGVLILGEPGDAEPLRLARWIRSQQVPVRILLKPVGTNPDELDPNLVSKCDLVIPPDVPEEAVLSRINHALTHQHL
jgi:signal transduction histidine kinase